MSGLGDKRGVAALRYASDIAGRGLSVLPHQRSDRLKDSLRLILIFLAAACSFFYVNVGSQLYVVEVLLAAGLLLKVPGASRPRLGFGLGLGLLLWAFGSIVSDLFVENDSLAVVKGILRVLFFATDLFALYYLCAGNSKAVQALWAGIAVSGFLGYFVQPSFAAAGEPWKFGIGLPVTLVVVLWAALKERSRFVNVGAFVALAGLHFLLGFRGMSSITLVCALLMLVRVGAKPARSERRFSTLRTRPIVLGLVGIVAILMLSATYDGLAEQGAFGPVAQQKAQYQSDGAYGSSLSSRSELLLSVQTIAKSPIIGGGSYSVAASDVSNNAAAWLDSLGYTDVAARLSQGAPAYHSEILGIWAENGFLTLFFWVPFAVILIRAIYSVVYRETRLSPLIVYLSVLGLWDLVFSPFGADRRMWVAATVVAVIVARIRPEHQAKENDASNIHSHN